MTRNRRQSVISGLLTLLLVTSTFPIGAGTASAGWATNPGIPGDGHCGAAEGDIEIIPLITIVQDDCYFGGNNATLDAEQEEIDIYQSAQNERANARIYLVSLDNYLQDTETTALMIGKKAYIQELNNGSTKQAALTSARRAVANYYAKKQVNLIRNWDLAAIHFNYLHEVAENQSNVRDDFVRPNEPSQSYQNNYNAQINYRGVSNTTVPLVNGTSARAVQLHFQGGYYNNNWHNGTATATVTTTDGTLYVSNPQVRRLIVRPPTSNFDKLVYLNWTDYGSRYRDIEQQHQSVQNQLETFVNATYDEYQAGEINNSDLFDPYIAQRSYSPNGSFQTWAATALATLGTSTPTNMDNIGSFRIESGGQTYEGLLLSDESPPGGNFSVNGTYDPSQINGTQYLVTDDRVRTLDSNFTIRNITDANGDQKRSVTIREIDYDTANTTELKKLYQELATVRAELEAMQKQQNSGGIIGGGLFRPGGSLGPTTTVLGGAAAVLLLIALLK